MTTALVDGNVCESLRLYVPYRGVWFADVVLLDDTELAGLVTIETGGVELSGTVTRSGSRGLQTFARVVAGAGAWGTLLPAKGYHSDSRVAARTVLLDAAREAGESIDASSVSDSLAVAYVRRSGPASRVLDDVLPAGWHVDRAGTLQPAPWPDRSPEADSYTVIETDPDRASAVLESDEIVEVWPGSTLSENLDAPLTVRELEFSVNADNATIRVWGGDSNTGDRAGRALRTLIDRACKAQIFGLWRYRVIKMSGDRVDLKAVSAAAGLPDVVPIDMAPGVAGAHAELAAGAEVLVQFVEGDPRRPVLSGFGGRGAPGHVPVRSTLDASTEVLLGGGNYANFGNGDALKTLIDAIAAAPISYGPSGPNLFQSALLTALNSAGFLVGATAPTTSLNIQSSKHKVEI